MIEEENDIIPRLDVTMQTQDVFSFNCWVFSSSQTANMIIFTGRNDSYLKLFPLSYQDSPLTTQPYFLTM